MKSIQSIVVSRFPTASTGRFPVLKSFCLKNRRNFWTNKSSKFINVIPIVSSLVGRCRIVESDMFQYSYRTQHKLNMYSWHIVDKMINELRVGYVCRLVALFLAVANLLHIYNF